jgi:hypothetical protein
MKTPSVANGLAPLPSFAALRPRTTNPVSGVRVYAIGTTTQYRAH